MAQKLQQEPIIDFDRLEIIRTGRRPGLRSGLHKNRRRTQIGRPVYNKAVRLGAVAELADAGDLKSPGVAPLVGSIPTRPTRNGGPAPEVFRFRTGRTVSEKKERCYEKIIPQPNLGGMHFGRVFGRLRPADVVHPDALVLFPTPNLTMTALFQIPPTATTGAVATVAQTADADHTVQRPTRRPPPTAPTWPNSYSETIADLTSIAPGTAFVKTWTLQNIGHLHLGRRIRAGLRQRRSNGRSSLHSTYRKRPTQCPLYLHG